MPRFPKVRKLTSCLQGLPGRAYLLLRLSGPLYWKTYVKAGLRLVVLIHLVVFPLPEIQLVLDLLLLVDRGEQVIGILQRSLVILF